MTHLVSTDVAKARIAKWFLEAKPIDINPTWTERRQAIEYGGHTYLIANGQIFQCAHCGHYDPQWSVHEVLTFFREVLGVKPTEIEITCTIDPKGSSE